MITLKGIIKTYPGKTQIHALNGVNLEIDAGEIFGIIGQSGAGKSTLIRCINMLEKPTSGSVMIDGHELTTMNERQLREERKSIGMIFQHFNLLSSRTVYGNIAFPLELAGASKAVIKERVESLLQLVGLTERSNNYPAQLSGGQKQRVGIARALANNPKVLLCDEATSALDPQTTKSILALLKDINDRLNLTIVVITHEMQVIKDICHRVAVIEDGKILEQGKVVDVFINPKSPTAKEFVNSIITQGIPEGLQELPISAVPVENSHMLIRLSFQGDVTEKPIVASLIRKFDLDVSILYGNVDYIQNTPFGRLIVMFEGSPDKQQAGLAYIKSLPIGSEVLGYVISGNN